MALATLGTGETPGANRQNAKWPDRAPTWELGLDTTEVHAFTSRGRGWSPAARRGDQRSVIY